MKFSLLDNAVDSLRSTFISLGKITELIDGQDHHIKDAILSLNHANELLFKYLLKKDREYLNSYMKAKEDMKKRDKKNIFEVAPNLQTVGFSEAIKRLELLCDIEVPEKLKKSLMYLNKKRNEIMHYELNLHEGELLTLVSSLSECYEVTVEYFSTHEEHFEDMVAMQDLKFLLMIILLMIQMWKRCAKRRIQIGLKIITMKSE
ncbi:hypothetical protein EI976_05110 [Bacillus licheniformis]|uniref:hypothetical protein n=1 Tax=Bacillus licheniformis TaxID=1402 RepID=UPI0002FD6436|nr:hypothetical protein [Bacillus licheniformis]AYC51991.1 hypothetical protein C7M53_12085 [Bacillus licheniformis]KAA0813126.1 hypothetical protein EI978_08200 [Bacillus licheniformis]KAA0821315.1 hypothetical protein EI973_19210 [Bacillus licheniformis]KAA0826425.1 hypothetical protein EI976_05110 [Bacillus licheniformis]MBU8781530.1 hypothetical protein [Bacillus licheniformis]